MPPPEKVATPFTIRLFGPFDARVNGAPLPHLRSRKGQWLLALLALRHGGTVERAWLAGTLWPDSPEPQALLSLRISLKDLRRALGPEASRLRSPTSHTLCLDLSGAEADVVAFDTAMARGEPASLEEAVSLYRGPLLEGCLEDWLLGERQAREETYLAALEKLATYAAAGGDLAAAARHLRLAVCADPSRETAQRALMEALAASGNYAAVTEVYRELRRHLYEELNAEPDPATRALFEQLRADARQRTVGSRQTAASSGQEAGDRGQAAGGSARLEGRRQETESSGRLEGSQEHSSGLPPPDCRLPPAVCLLAPGLEPLSGAVPLDSEFYVVRPADQEFRRAIARRDSIVLVKGARQMGKTSLLGRGLQQARQAGARVVMTDFQTLNVARLASAEVFFLAVGSALADRLELDVFPDQVWEARFGPGMNFDRYLRRQVLAQADAPIVWGLDEVDQLASRDFGSEFFGLLRSWHNQRVTDPEGPWSRLTLAIAYATEAHLLITDPNQSPFNVGTRLVLDEFTLEEVEELNRRYGTPLRDRGEVTRFYDLVGGHPFRVRRGLHEMVSRGLRIGKIEAEEDQDDGAFGDHLRRLLVVLTRSPELIEPLRSVLQGRPCPGAESFYRLRSAGLISGLSAREARPCCRLCAAYLERHLR